MIDDPRSGHPLPRQGHAVEDRSRGEDKAPQAKLLLVDDHPLLSQSLALALRADGIEVERCDLTEEAILGAAETADADLVLLDLDLGPPVGSSLRLIPPLVSSGARVVILTGVTERVRLAECVESGALGVIRKSAPFEELVEGVRRVVEHGALTTDHERQELLAELRRHRAAERARLEMFEQLTPRERAVLAALMEGLSAEQMARQWVVSLATVRSQIRSLLSKLDVNSQLSAVAVARRAGWSLDRD